MLLVDDNGYYGRPSLRSVSRTSQALPCGTCRPHKRTRLRLRVFMYVCSARRVWIMDIKMGISCEHRARVVEVFHLPATKVGKSTGGLAHL